MGNGWSAKDYANGSVISGIVSNQPVSREFPITAGGALNGILKIQYSGVTQVGTITPKLQVANGSDWVDAKSGAAITAAGTQYIRWNIEVAADQSALPLLNRGRLVITTTNGSDALSVDLVELLQAL